MLESSGIISRHELCFQPSSSYRSVPTLERITIDWGSQIYHDDNYKHLCDAFIDPDQDLQCTDEDESLFLFDSESSGTPMDIEDIIPSDEDMFCVSEGESTGNNIPSNK